MKKKKTLPHQRESEPVAVPRTAVPLGVVLSLAHDGGEDRGEGGHVVPEVPDSMWIKKRGKGGMSKTLKPKSRKNLFVLFLS
jgi:hypothetical protein